MSLGGTNETPPHTIMAAALVIFTMMPLAGAAYAAGISDIIKADTPTTITLPALPSAIRSR